jgi:hypothetical protein
LRVARPARPANLLWRRFRYEKGDGCFFGGTVGIRGRTRARDDIAERCKGILVVRKRDVCAAWVPHAATGSRGNVAAGVFLRIDPKRFSRIVVMGPQPLRRHA